MTTIKDYYCCKQTTFVTTCSYHAISNSHAYRQYNVIPKILFAVPLRVLEYYYRLGREFLYDKIIVCG